MTVPAFNGRTILESDPVNVCFALGINPLHSIRVAITSTNFIADLKVAHKDPTRWSEHSCSQGLFFADARRTDEQEGVRRLPLDHLHQSFDLRVMTDDLFKGLRPITQM